MTNDEEIAALYSRAVQDAPPGALLVELGVWVGTSLVAMAGAARRLGRSDLRILGVDMWEGSAGEPDLQEEAARTDLHSVTITNLREAGLLGMVALLRYDSVKAAHLFPDQSVDFVFHDSCHLKEHVLAELAAWRPKVRIGGTQAGHDAGREGVDSAVREFFKGRAKTEGSCWCIQR